MTIFFAFAAGLAVLALEGHLTMATLGMLVGGSIITAIGIFDDICVLGCYRKLLGQTLVAGLAALCGFTVDTVVLPFWGPVELGPFGYMFSVLWMLVVMNAMNLLDGLDGLASSVSILIAMFSASSAILLRNYEIAVLAILLIASISGFLRYNLPPARIFMGDTGSLFIGFVLASLSLKAFAMDSAIVHTPLMFLIFSVPFLDTSLAVVRRLFQKQHPFTPDKKHIHHRLIDLRLSHLSAMTILSGITLVCGLVGISLIYSSSYQILICLSGLGFLFFILLRHLDCFDFVAKNRLAIKPNGLSISESSVTESALEYRTSLRSFASSSISCSSLNEEPSSKPTLNPHDHRLEPFCRRET